MKKVLILFIVCFFTSIAFADEYKCDYDGAKLNTNLYRILSIKGVNQNISGIVCFNLGYGQIRLKLQDGVLDNFIESIRYSKDKKPLLYTYSSDYDKFFTYNILNTDIFNNGEIIKKLAGDMDYTFIMYHPVTYNKVVDIIIKDNAGTATFYHENNTAQYVLPIDSQGLSNKGKSYDENGNFIADITTNNGSITEVLCASGRKLSAKNIYDISQVINLCK